MAKPFSIQSPEEIAKEYAGNKQKIAQAMQMGIVDATAGVLAGMFIDRMRAAQMQEAIPQTTVAQQVMGGAAPTPVPPQSSAGVAGLVPQAAPPMAPEPPAMQPPMEEAAPIGMASGGYIGNDMFSAPYMNDGGLASLDVPDDMFSEPTNGGYAGGGLVAFADGGSTSQDDFFNAIVQQESGGNYRARNKSSGAMGKYQLMPDTARALARRLGLPYRPELLTADSEEARKYQDTLGSEALGEAWNYGKGDVNRASAYYFAGPNTAKWGPKTDKYMADINSRLGMTSVVPERNENTATGRLASLEDVVGMMDRRFAKTEEEKATDEALRARAKEMASPEYYEQQRKDSMWETLAEIGFNMASTKSPSLLQAIGEAASAALPGAKADKKERKQLKDRALNLMMELGAKDRKEAMEKFKVAADVWQTGLSQEQFEEKMALSRDELQLAREKLDAEIAAAANKAQDPKDVAVRWILTKPKGSAEYAAAENYFQLTNPRSGGAMTPEDIKALQGGRTSGGFTEGQTAKDTTGKTIVFQGGQWVYP